MKAWAEEVRISDIKRALLLAYYGNELAQSIKASLDIKFGFIHTLQVYLQVAFQLFSVHWVQHAVSISIDKLFELYILSYLINNTWTC